MTKHLIRSADLDWNRAFRGRHPFNPASEMSMIRLGDLSGLTRLGANLIRIPPGKESFIPHAHSMEEELVLVISGTGQVVLDGVAQDIGPGDFVGFPTDGVVHHLVNTGQVDLVYLTVGERSRVEVANMPTIGRTTVFRNNTMTLFGPDSMEQLTAAEWFARMKIED
ncbi:MAG: cupin domain-containing protein [Phenylobacterium sp.]|uniref:cupin domain-containing protein n=1 Tax=Phenylobacterium sp. TaxID=1871053 RepID=UPI0027364878|nr:cupin domain-containing protein [Phenylobacterium sp.]MDP3749689.1 cupin domain-containing protein [Phenylobacterium sp.]